MFVRIEREIILKFLKFLLIQQSICWKEICLVINLVLFLWILVKELICVILILCLFIMKMTMSFQAKILRNSYSYYQKAVPTSDSLLKTNIVIYVVSRLWVSYFKKSRNFCLEEKILTKRVVTSGKHWMYTVGLWKRDKNIKASIIKGIVIYKNLRINRKEKELYFVV